MKEIDEQIEKMTLLEVADHIKQLQLKFDRLFDVTKRYVECEHAQLRGEHFRDMAATIEALEGTQMTYGWPQCFSRVEKALKWVIEKLRTHHSSRPGITAICDRAERCLIAGSEIGE